MKFSMIHENYNVSDLDRSMEFYRQALGLEEVRRKEAADGSFIIVYMAVPGEPFELELTWLREHPQKYDLGECEFHLAFRTDDFAAAHEKHFFTKRIDRLSECLPGDWGAGYEHVTIGCTVENQRMADYRLPIFQKLPIRHKIIVCAPLIGPIDLAPYLGPEIEQVSVGGESGPDARVCDYAWVLSLRDQCAEHDVSFCFHQTGARLLKDGRLYRIRRQFQHTQARKAGIDFKVGG